MYLGIVTTSYSGALFTPTILKQLGWTSIKAQVMSIPIFIVATILALTCAWLSDRLRRRMPFILLGCLVATTGYAIMLAMHQVPVGARYAAIYLIVGGGFMAQPITLVWLNNNLGGHYKRGVGAAIQVSIGNIGKLRVFPLLSYSNSSTNVNEQVVSLPPISSYYSKLQPTISGLDWTLPWYGYA